MKILILSKHFWPENFRINIIANKLSDKHQVTVLAEKPSYSKVKKNYNKINKKIKIKRFWTYPRSKNFVSIFLNYLSFIFIGSIKIFELNKKKKFDLIFIYATSPIFQAIPAIIYGKIKKVPTFLWVQDLWPEVLMDLKIFNYKILLNLIKKITKLIYENTNFIFAQSLSFKKSVEKLSKKKADILYNPEIGNNLKFNTNKKNKITLIFAGNLGKAQNLPIIIKVANELKDSNLLIKIYGSGSERYNLQKLINHYKIYNIVTIFDPISIIRLKQEMQKADGLLITLNKGAALSKTLPAKLQTYLSQGKPIICSADGELYNFIKKNKVGFASKSNDISGMIDSIKKLKNLTKRKKKEIFIRSYKIFKLHFDLVNWIERLNKKLYIGVKIYTKTLNQ